MSIHEIVLPKTKPETEWILGRAVRKVSPRTTHSLLQSALVIALGAHGARTLHNDETLAHPALPGFALSLREQFAAAEPPR